MPPPLPPKAAKRRAGRRTPTPTPPAHGKRQSGQQQQARHEGPEQKHGRQQDPKQERKATTTKSDQSHEAQAARHNAERTQNPEQRQQHATASRTTRQAKAQQAANADTKNREHAHRQPDASRKKTETTRKTPPKTQDTTTTQYSYVVVYIECQGRRLGAAVRRALTLDTAFDCIMRYLVLGVSGVGAFPCVSSRCAARFRRFLYSRHQVGFLFADLNLFRCHVRQDTRARQAVTFCMEQNVSRGAVCSAHCADTRAESLNVSDIALYDFIGSLPPYFVGLFHSLCALVGSIPIT